MFYAIVYFAIGIAMLFIFSVVQGEDLYKNKGEDVTGAVLLGFVFLWPLVLFAVLIDGAIKLNKVLFRTKEKK